MPAGDGKVPFLQPIKRDYPFIRRGDADSFPALFFDNLSSILGIIFAMVFVVSLAQILTGGPLSPITPAHVLAYQNMVFGKIVPGLAFALAFGNIWYAWMAFKLAGYENRDDVTALPYGINTPAGFIMAFSVMLPLCFKHAGTADPEEFALRVWSGAVSANFISGVFEVCGFWMGNIIRTNMSKAALYSPIAAVGFVWLGLSPFISVASEPIIGFIPFALTFTGFFANEGKGIYKSGSTALIIFGTGTVLKWAGAGKYQGTPAENEATLKFMFNTFAGQNSLLPGVGLRGMVDVGDFIAILFPVALQSFIETMENVEAAMAKGDHYNVMEAMVVDGIGTMIGAFFGCTLPTTVYIGHARHKKVGAAAGYSLINAFVYVIILMSGMFPTVFALVDRISIGCILIFVGLMIVQQSFEVSSSRHYPALCLGIMVVIADIMRLESGDTRPGVLNLAAGSGIMASLILTQIMCDLIDLRFDRCAVFCVIGTIFSLTGVMHGNNVIDLQGQPTVELGELTISYADGGDYYLGKNESWRFAVGYTMLVLFCLGHLGAQKMGWIQEAIMDNGVNTWHPDHDKMHGGII